MIHWWVDEHAGVLLVMGFTAPVIRFFFYDAFAFIQTLLCEETVSNAAGDPVSLLSGSSRRRGM